MADSTHGEGVYLQGLSGVARSGRIRGSGLFARVVLTLVGMLISVAYVMTIIVERQGLWASALATLITIPIVAAAVRSWFLGVRLLPHALVARTWWRRVEIPRSALRSCVSVRYAGIFTGGWGTSFLRELEVSTAGHGTTLLSGTVAFAGKSKRQRDVVRRYIATTAAEVGGGLSDGPSVLGAVRERFEDPSNLLTRQMSWVGGRDLGDGRMVILFHYSDPTVVWGCLVATADHVTSARPHPSRGDIVDSIIEEVAESTSQVHTADLDWAAGMVDTPESIFWRDLDTNSPELVGRLRAVQPPRDEPGRGATFSGGWV